MQIADRIYEKLTPEERFRAAVEAFARRDVEEIDRLNDTCPVETVRTQSRAYFGRLRGFHELAMMHGIFARDVMLGIWICYAKLSRAPGPTPESGKSDSEGDHAESSSGATEAELEPEDDKLCSTLCTLVARLGAHRAAWAEFCASVGVDPAMPEFAYFRESQQIIESFDRVEPDLEYQATLVKSLRECWGMHISRS